LGVNKKRHSRKNKLNRREINQPEGVKPKKNESVKIKNWCK